ncbi:MAG: hypothetical protein KGZ66_11120, partial [Selenomonadales bacterium]|nr:hypothetical protein [Selenomonadales bacterium]
FFIFRLGIVKIFPAAMRQTPPNLARMYPRTPLLRAAPVFRRSSACTPVHERVFARCACNHPHSDHARGRSRFSFSFGRELVIRACTPSDRRQG